MLILKRNSVGEVIRYIGIGVIALSFLVGIIVGFETGILEGVIGDPKFSFNWLAALFSILSGAVTGFLIIGFSEVIKLLQSISEYLKVLNSKTRYEE